MQSQDRRGGGSGNAGSRDRRDCRQDPSPSLRLPYSKMLTRPWSFPQGQSTGVQHVYQHVSRGCNLSAQGIVPGPRTGGQKGTSQVVPLSRALAVDTPGAQHTSHPTGRVLADSPPSPPPRPPYLGPESMIFADQRPADRPRPGSGKKRSRTRHCRISERVRPPGAPKTDRCSDPHGLTERPTLLLVLLDSI